MGHRLSKIYTRTGDDGTSGLGDGGRVDKDSPRVEAYGTVDELNAALGLVLAGDLPARLHEMLTALQHDLFDLGGELCLPGRAVLDAGDVKRLEQWLDQLNANLSPLEDFVLPAGGPATAACHLARTVCRRAERRMVALARTDRVNEHSLAFINRLSDLLFVMARVLVRHERGKEIVWQHRDRRTPAD